MSATLREITAETVRRVIALSVAPGQERFVAPNAVSLAQALFSDEAWFRGVWLDGEPVGFVMVADESLRRPPPEGARIRIWRLMVDHRFQGRGVGREVVAQVAEHARSRGFDRLYTSYVPEPGGPEPFYRRIGFVPTGEIDKGEAVAVLELGDRG